MQGNTRGFRSVGGRLAPFIAAAVVTWVTVAVGERVDWPLFALAAALAVGSGALAAAATLFALRRPEGWAARFGGIVASLAFLGAVALLRQSAGGGGSGAAVVSVIPVFYTALHSRARHQLYVVLAGMAAFYFAPIVLIGGSAYPATQYRAALLTVAVGGIVGLATRQLVIDVRHQAGEARGRERMLAQVNEAVRGLLGSSQTRVDVCQAACRIGEASVAVLFEPLPGTRRMRATAIVGVDASPVEIAMLQPPAVGEAFASGVSRLVESDVESHVGSVLLWEAAGRPATLLYEPLSRGGESVGVLVVGWPSGVQASGSRAAVVAVLAHEAAAVIDRADAVSELSDMASTDPLTGLPNRRAWDARVGQALGSGKPFTIAMLDLDHFKQYNDTYGHPAGDRLLKETAAIWREQLRVGDLLARLGGEEFGLLLIDCDTPRAIEVIERLRRLVSGDRTCSAGFAEHRPGESAETVLARADAALYEAKSSGRDRLCMSA
ncbi:MAG TPA: sensor domain-containing diguanylate cyclase [Solirubrobacteraceae bacterium]|nr:sensor domain-containing diguanylate cyclase [Solirubrobacteraceae bacterium]